MKIWFECIQKWEEGPKLGIDWYKHHSKHPWKGITVHFFFFKWILILNAVDNFKEYDLVINKRRKK